MSSFFFLISSSANRFCSIYRSLSSSVILASFFLPDFFFLGGIFGKKLKKFRSVNAKQDGVDQLLLLTTLPLVLHIVGSKFASRPLSVISSGVQFVIRRNLTWELFENSFFKKDISRFIFLDGWKNEEKKNWCRRIWTPRWDSRAEHGGRGVESV